MLPRSIDADRGLLFAAVGSLLESAFKFTRPGRHVTFSAYQERQFKNKGKTTEKDTDEL